MDEAISLIYEVSHSEFGFCDRGAWEEGYGPAMWRTNEMQDVIAKIDRAIVDRNPQHLIELLRMAKGLLAVDNRDIDDRLDKAISILLREVAQ